MPEEINELENNIPLAPNGENININTTLTEEDLREFVINLERNTFINNNLNGWDIPSTLFRGVNNISVNDLTNTLENSNIIESEEEINNTEHQTFFNDENQEEEHIDEYPIEVLNRYPYEEIKRLENRVLNHSSTYKESYSRAINELDEERIIAYLEALESNLHWSHLDFPHSSIDKLKKTAKTIKKVDPNEKVKLFEDDGKEYLKSELIYIKCLGFFLKDDKRIINDYFWPDQKLINDPKYYNKYCRIYDNINEKGELIGDNFTLFFVQLNPSVWISKTPRIYYLGREQCFNIKLIDNKLFNYWFKEDLNNGVFYHKDNFNETFKKAKKIQYRKHKGKFGEFFNSIKDKPNTFLKTFGMRFKFGLETETISGYFPQYLDNFLFYSAVHDGSLRDAGDNNVYGMEMVSDVLQGDLGLKHMKKILYEMSRRCLTNKKCSNHFHISGDKNTFNKENIVLMYYLYRSLENELFSMMPISRRDNEYCRRLEPININLDNITKDRKYYIDLYYKEIVEFLSQKEPLGSHVNKKKDHPKGPKCGYDHSTARYCWVNFIPAVFDTRGNSQYTIEFRLMSASTSYYKIKNWLLLCFALVDIVENHKQEIYKHKQLTLSNIIEICYPRNFKKIVDYIDLRKKKFEDNSESVEIKDYLDNEEDNDFSQKGI